MNIVDEEEEDGDPPSAPVAILGVADGRWCSGGSRLNGWLVDGQFSQSSQLTRSPAVRFGAGAGDRDGDGVITGL